MVLSWSLRHQILFLDTLSGLLLSSFFGNKQFYHHFFLLFLGFFFLHQHAWFPFLLTLYLNFFLEDRIQRAFSSVSFLRFWCTFTFLLPVTCYLSVSIPSTISTSLAATSIWQWFSSTLSLILKLLTGNFLKALLQLLFPNQQVKFSNFLHRISTCLDVSLCNFSILSPGCSHIYILASCISWICDTNNFMFSAYSGQVGLTFACASALFRVTNFSMLRTELRALLIYLNFAQWLKLTSWGEPLKFGQNGMTNDREAAIGEVYME